MSPALSLLQERRDAVARRLTWTVEDGFVIGSRRVTVRVTMPFMRGAWAFERLFLPETLSGRNVPVLAACTLMDMQAAILEAVEPDEVREPVHV